MCSSPWQGTGVYIPSLFPAPLRSCLYYIELIDIGYGDRVFGLGGTLAPTGTVKGDDAMRSSSLYYWSYLVNWLFSPNYTLCVKWTRQRTKKRQRQRLNYSLLTTAASSLQTKLRLSRRQSQIQKNVHKLRMSMQTQAFCLHSTSPIENERYRFISSSCSSQMSHFLVCYTISFKFVSSFSNFKWVLELTQSHRYQVESPGSCRSILSSSGCIIMFRRAISTVQT